MTLMSYGKPACVCLSTWLPLYERELKARGLLARDRTLTVYQLIGGAPKSAGVHLTGGAFDLLDLPGEEDLWVARQMGADATWSRRENWDGRGGMAHIHGVLTGCPHAADGALRQIESVRNGRNGLVSNLPDDGPRPLSGRTWQQGIAWHHEQAKARARVRLTTRIREKIAEREPLRVAVKRITAAIERLRAERDAL